MVRKDILEQEIQIPEGLTVDLDGKKITVKGEKGKLVKDFTHAKGIDIVKNGDKIIITAMYPKKKQAAMMGTIKSLINNMFLGLLKGPFIVKMKIVYAHFPINVSIKGNEIIIENFLGERAPRKVVNKYKDVKVRVEGDDVIVEGIDKEKVGQVAANIRRATKIKDKDPRTFQDGIYPYQKLLADKEIWTLKF
ncbi:MAG: 50S ribosomal protein L6 [Candidatus Helarchaeales archaeon]